MAEGWARSLKNDSIDPYSAGIETHGLNPYAVKVMAAAGIDITDHRSKQVDELAHVNFDYVITVCSHANDHCALFPGKAKVIHQKRKTRPRGGDGDGLALSAGDRLPSGLSLQRHAVK